MPPSPSAVPKPATPVNFPARPFQVPPASRENGRRPRFVVRLQEFWYRVTEGLALNQLWSQFKRDARSSYRLYSRDFQAGAPQETRRRNFWHTAQEFAWAILSKLTPARRVLLLVGLALLVFPAGGFSYHGETGEVEVVEFDSHFFGGVLLFLVLMLEVADRVVMKRDLEIARDIQKWLLPATPPEVPGLAIAFATRAANTVAGDYYDVFPRSASSDARKRFVLAIADVAGKSIPAALLMATFQASLRTLSATSGSLRSLVEGMNRYACSNSQSGLRFTTAFISEFDSESRVFTYINAGHNAPIVRRDSGTLEHLTMGGLPLGIRSEGSYDSGEVLLQTSDWLITFTDGLVEALNERGQEYGEQGLVRVLQASANTTPVELLRQVMSDVDAFVGDTPQHDDITCMFVKVTG
jgi:sigma-B regulation protein RsbU (phosphoserine phosphatase)